MKILEQKIQLEENICFKIKLKSLEYYCRDDIKHFVTIERWEKLFSNPNKRWTDEYGFAKFRSRKRKIIGWEIQWGPSDKIWFPMKEIEKIVDKYLTMVKLLC